MSLRAGYPEARCVRGRQLKRKGGRGRSGVEGKRCPHSTFFSLDQSVHGA